ncbi:MAG TPA: isoleucine--tRNA ligase [Fibrobacteria bacterium]|nr:isoleucine--tRNA ligase [Fibrobacteria bacterium]
MFRSPGKNQSFPEMERRLLKLWEADDSFRKSVEARPAGKAFIFNDGPPFATGLPHYGHLLAGTIKDIVPRYWTMKGYRVERRFGWDCHGLPIENLIQDKLNLKTVRDIHDYGVDKFNEACRASVLTYTAEWRKTVGRMGRWVDFDNEYKTMDATFMESVWWVFKQCFDKGLIYQGYRIQPYSPALATSLSNFEVNQAYRDRQDPSVTLAFQLEAPHHVADHHAPTTVEESDEQILVWTTTPWTLPGNMAIALHPELDYTLVRHEGKKYWIAEARRAAYFPEPKAGKKSEVLETRKGRDFAGRRYKPLFQYMPYMTDKQYTILMADFVSAEDGAGSVHIAPSFGEEDFQLGKAEGLGLFDPLDAEGKFTHLVPEWQGIGAKDADKSILQHLKAQGRVFRHETLVHSYPHCWRTDVPLLYRAQKNWFLSLEKEITSAPDASSAGVTKTLKQWMIDGNRQINWVPDHIKGGRFGKWLEGARDWNLSRNRFWGTCIPIWLAEDGDMLCVGSVAELEALTGKQVRDLHKHIVDPLVIRTKDGKTYDPAGKEYRRTPEVLDCWFESGSMPYAQPHYPFENKEWFARNFPADFIAEGLDQTRGWFYTLTVLGAALFQKPAFKNVIVNGIILAEDGQKMSKRLKNYPDPNELIDRTSADAIRLFMIDSAAVKAEELKFSETGVKNITRAVLLPLWNSLSLFATYANADAGKGQLTWRPGQDLKSENELDRWILSDLQQLLAKVQAEMDAYRLFNVVPAVVEFIDDLTNWYIRRSRRRFWKSENDQDKNFAYATLYRVLVDFSKVLAPFLPFLAEELYQILVREPGESGKAVFASGSVPSEANPGDSMQPVSVHLCDFPVFDAGLHDPALNAKMARVRQAVNLGRSLRSQHNLKNRQPLRQLIVVVRNEEQKREILGMEDLIREELNVKAVEVSLDEASLVTYKGKANFKSLGARLGKAMKTVAEKVAKLSHEEIKSVLSGKPFGLEEGELTAEDILVVRETREGLVVEASPELTVALDTAVDHGLRLEMLARESVSKIQNLRKDSGLEVTDQVEVSVKTGSQLFREALETHFTYITAEVLASSLGFSETVREEEGNSLEINGEIAVFSVSKKV